MRFFLLSLFLLMGLNHVLAQCSDVSACNYDPSNTGGGSSSACVTIETHVVHDSGELNGMTTYRVYVNLPESDNFLSAISTILMGCTDNSACNYAPAATYDDGSCEFTSCPPGSPQADEDATPSTIRITSTTSFYQSEVGSSTADGIMSSLFGFFPTLVYDSWVTIGHAPEDGTPGATVSTIASPSQNWVANFEAGDDLIMDDLIGGLWYIFNDGNDQGVPDENGKVLIAQLTTDGTVGVEISGQYFPDFGTGANGEADGTSSSLFVSDISTPCPNDPNAGCEYAESGLDCNGDCLNDSDSDGVCDENDPCIGDYDVCNICNGPGEIYECGCADIPAGDCDCNGNQLDALQVCGGDCAADADGDGICDNVDPCVGALDACGICNGPGAIYDCGCSDYPEGDCDCNGNQADALGTCGGTCEADADSDGLCDDTDPCIGSYDALGVCNGSCAADDDNDDICDDTDPCVGQYDALGICNGDCPSDLDGDNVCDNAEIPGCTDEDACNYNEEATDEDGSCAELDAIGNCGGTCTADSDEDGVCDDVDPCIGSYDECGICNGPGSIYDCGCSDIPAGDCDCEGNVADVVGQCGGTCTEDADSDGICDDIDACVGTLDACGICNGPGLIYQCGCTNIPEGDCDCNGNQTDAIGVCGGDCTEDLNNNGICDDHEDLLDNEGCTDSSACNYSNCATTDDGSCLYDDALGVCGGDCSADTDGDGICDDAEVEGCTNSFACNYDPAATDDNGSCLTADVLGDCGGACTADADGDGICDDADDCVGSLDACGVCNGPGEVYDCGCSDIPAGDCDCSGSQTDALGVCGGDCSADTDGDGICDDAEVEGCTNSFACNYDPAATDDNGSCLTADVLGDCGGACTADADGDGICDDADDCVGSLDACGVCNGPGEVYDCGCSDIPAGDCDCSGSQTDALGVCGGDCSADTDGDGICDDAEVEGCTNSFACNYDPAATDDNGSCLTADVLGDCGGACTADADGDGICDDADDCVGSLDACGVCNGPGEVYDCGCSDIPSGDCDCSGSQTDALGVCGGDCSADTDGDGICDDAEVEGCTNSFACNYDPAATDDNGSCLTADVLGDCGGACTADADGDGICDDADDCVGSLDACGVCNGPGEVYDCGCSDIPAGDCDCAGSQIDALGVCGGDCSADINANGICDNVEILGCTYESAENYNALANWDDGSCTFDTGEPQGSCFFDFNGDGGVGAGDLLDFLIFYGDACE